MFTPDADIINCTVLTRSSTAAARGNKVKTVKTEDTNKIADHSTSKYNLSL
jgi:hypothetical protein